MNTASKHPLDTPYRRLLAGVLVACLVLAAVPALAHCCADRCHDAEPVAEAADACDCSLNGVEPPTDALAFAPDNAAATITKAPVDIADAALPTSPDAAPVPAAPRAGPDRTVVLLI